MTTYSLEVLPFSIWNQSVVPCPVLTVASWPAFLQISHEAGQVVWCSHSFQNFPQFTVIHTVKGLGIVNKAEIDVFQEFSCFFDDPADVGNLVFAEYIMQNAGLNDSQGGIKIARRNISSFRYADDTTLIVENEEELKSLLMRVKG